MIYLTRDGLFNYLNQNFGNKSIICPKIVVWEISKNLARMAREATILSRFKMKKKKKIKERGSEISWSFLSLPISQHFQCLFSLFH